jgi:hypothetical protein
MRAALPALMLLLAAGCASNKAFERMDAESKDDYLACHRHVAKAQCGWTPEEAAEGYRSAGFIACASPLSYQYSDTPKAARKTWLLRKGCPRDVVDPTDSLRRPEAPTRVLKRDRDRESAKEWDSIQPDRPDVDDGPEPSRRVIPVD